MADDQRPDDVEAIRAIADRLRMPKYDPAHDEPIETADEFVARMKAQEDQVAAARDRRHAANRSWRTVVTAIAAAAAVGLVLSIVNPWQRQSAYAGTPPMLSYGFADSGKVAYAPGRPAAATLQRMAQLAAANRTDPAGTGTQHIVTSGWHAQLDSKASTDSARVFPTLRETKLQPDGTVAITERRGAPLRADGRGIGADTRGSKTTETIPPGTYDPSYASDLGSSPAEVRARLLKRVECGSRSQAATTECLVGEIIHLNEHWVVSGGLRAALWTILSEQPNVRSLGNVEDRAGRPGIGVFVDTSGKPPLRTILVISRTDGRLLGVETVLTKDDPDTKVEAPAVYSFTAILNGEWSR